MANRSASARDQWLPFSFFPLPLLSSSLPFPILLPSRAVKNDVGKSDKLFLFLSISAALLALGPT